MKRPCQTLATKTFATKALNSLLTVCGLLLMIVLLYQSIASFAMNPDNYPVKNDQAFASMAEELTQYLSGRRPSLSSRFTEQEAAHMVDVLHLFQLGKRVSISAAVLLLIAVFFVWRGKVPGFWFIKQLQMGMGLFFVFTFLLAAWAAIDFNGWFIIMHKIAFSNDLWLLDPRESMLIQMLPVDFFMRAVRSILVRFLAYAAIVTMLTVLIRKMPKRGGRSNASP